MKILLADFSAKLEKEDIFKQTIGDETLREIYDDVVVTVVNFVTSRNQIVTITMFIRRNIHKDTRTSSDGKTCNRTEHTSIIRRRHSNMVDVR
jgi:hypothetical protein